MNGAHLHLMLNHFPLIGFIFSLLILLLGQFRSNGSYGRAGLLIILLSAAVAVPAFFSGEPAEDIIKELPAFSEERVEAHEEAAEAAIWFFGFTALAAGVALWFSDEKTNRSQLLLKLVIGLNVVSIIFAARASQLGGRISHPETRGGGVIQQGAPSAV